MRVSAVLIVVLDGEFDHVDSQAQMSQAVKVAEGVGGVKSVKNDMRLK